MKILSCFIENFGKIKKQAYDFNQGITSFCESNGFGKTTLACFIEAMFYGLESYRTGGKFCDRVHFAPFEGGAFGGNLTFESGGKVYKIERFFDEKSDTKDKLTVYCDGSLFSGFGEDIGKSIFGIDKASFERTVYIDSTEIDIASTGSINAKLNAFVEGGDSNLEQSMAILEKAAKEYKKSRTGNDLITKQKNKIDALRDSIRNTQNIASALTQKYHDYDGRKAAIEELEKQITLAQKSNVECNNWEHYDGMLADWTADKQSLNNLKANYPYGFPTYDETGRVSTLLAEEQKLEALAEQTTISRDDEARFQRWNQTFQNGMPDEQTLGQVEQGISRLTSIEAELAVLNDRKPTERELSLQRHFGRGVPTESQLSEAEKKLEAWKAADRELREMSAPLPAQEKKGTRGKGFALIAALCTLLLIGGVAMLFVLQAVGIALLVVGGAGLLIDGFFYLNKKFGDRSTQSNAVAFQTERLKKEQHKNELENSIKAFLAPYGYASENGVVFDFASCKEDVSAFLAYQKTEYECQTKRTESKAEHDTLTKKLGQFFAAFGYEGEAYGKNLSCLRADSNAFTSLKERIKLMKEDRAELEKKMSQNMQYVSAFCEKYHFDYATIGRMLKAIETDMHRLEELNAKVALDEKKCITFREQKNLSVRPEQKSLDIEELNRRLHTLQSEQSVAMREITDDELQAEKLDELQAELYEAEQKAAEYKKKYELLTITMGALTKADYNLKERYIKPVKDKFIEYAAVLERALGEKITMSKDFEIRFERAGKERSEKYLSSGQRSVCALCFRLALIDNMYTGEKPFLILDDPFVNLDDEHLKKVKSVLSELSNGMQMIYFACHESRAL